jgi:hypothetical protein
MPTHYCKLAIGVQSVTVIRMYYMAFKFWQHLGSSIKFNSSHKLLIMWPFDFWQNLGRSVNTEIK